MKSAAPSRPKRRGRTGLVVIAVLVLAAILVFAFQQFQKAGVAAAARADLLSRVAEETHKTPVDGSELSSLVASLQKLPDHETARDLLAAKARIDLARDRPERAMATFGNQANQPGASPAEQGLGAEILLRLQEVDGSDATASTGMLQQAMAFAENAYQASGDAADLQRAWQAATRLGDDVAGKRFAAMLLERHESTPAAALVRFASTFDPKDEAGLARTLAEFSRPPVELEAMRVLVVLQRGDLEGAAPAADALLLRGAGVLAARWAAALVFQACAQTHAAGSPGRATWIGRRDVQLDWLLARAPADDLRRATWNTLRGQR